MPVPHLCGTRFYRRFDQPMVEYEVLYDGVRMRCDPFTLQRLYDGEHPDCLDVIVVDGQEEERDD